jgi:hypothetical protein
MTTTTTMTTMTSARAILLAMALATMTAACGSDSPVAPTPVAPVVPVAPVIPACQANHTASASFQNASSKTLDIVLDGGVIGTLTPGQSGLTRVVAASVAHSIVFRVTNTTVSACAAFNPIPVECSSPVYASCSF